MLLKNRRVFPLPVYHAKKLLHLCRPILLFNCLGIEEGPRQTEAAVCGYVVAAVHVCLFWWLTANAPLIALPSLSMKRKEINRISRGGYAVENPVGSTTHQRLCCLRIYPRLFFFILFCVKRESSL